MKELSGSYSCYVSREAATLRHPIKDRAGTKVASRLSIGRSTQLDRTLSHTLVSHAEDGVSVMETMMMSMYPERPCAVRSNFLRSCKVIIFD
jgi:hypothetical protein